MTQPAATGRLPAAPSVFLLGLLATSSPLSLSMHVPTIPKIAAALDTDYATVQLTVSLYLLCFAVAQLFVGPLSDRLGRRPVLFGGLSLYIVAGIVAAFAPTIEVLIVARLFQACGGCAAIVVPRAVVQDTHHGADAARVMAFVAMLQSTAPSAAPVIGGALDALIGWRATFGFLAMYGAVLMSVAAFRLQETRPLGADGRVATWGEIFSRYGRLLRSRRYIGYTIAFAFGTSGFFGFLAVGPGYLIDELGLTIFQFSLALMSVTVQFVIGSFVASRLVIRFGIDRTLAIGATVQIAAATALLLLALTPTRSVAALLVPMWFYAFSNGFIFPNAMAGATGVDRRIAGAAASFLGFVQLGIGSMLAGSIGSLPPTSAIPLGVALMIFALMSAFGMVLVRLSPP
jgi:DHA1 family bicyclomycin/chloramphenicol resistance-like MFS transporter